MSRILLIKCNEYVYPYAITHPLGLMHLSSALKKDGPRDIKIIDTRLRGRMSLPELLQQSARFKPDIIGLSSILVEANNLHLTTAALKKQHPRVFIIAGGPYPSSCPETILNDNNISCAVSGEGEPAFIEIVKRTEQNLPLHGVPGTSTLIDGKPRQTPRANYIQDIDQLPFPDWDAAGVAAYNKERRMSNTAPGPYMTLFTSRSCPYNCVYCHNIFGKGFRARSAPKVLEEINTLRQRHNINQFEIIDDTFNLDRARLIQICDLIINSGVKIKLYFPNALRCDLLDRETCRKLKAAGTLQVTVAIETATPRLQKLIKKNLNLDRARESIGHLTRAGILTHGFFMLGFPTETQQEMDATINFACRSRLHSASFFIVTPAPGTELHNMLPPSSAPADTSITYKSYSYQSLEITSSHLPPETLRKTYRRAFSRFYLNPLRAARIIIRKKDKAFLLQNALHALQRLLLDCAKRAPKSNTSKQQQGNRENVNGI